MYHFCSILCQLLCFEQIYLIGIKLENWSKWPRSVNRNLVKNTCCSIEIFFLYYILKTSIMSKDFRFQKISSHHSKRCKMIFRINFFWLKYPPARRLYNSRRSAFKKRNPRKKRLSAHAKANIANNENNYSMQAPPFPANLKAFNWSLCYGAKVPNVQRESFLLNFSLTDLKRCC